MTTLHKETVKCYRCKKKSEHTVVMSTSSFGYADLDGRPPMMQRNTIIYQVRECPHCGYVGEEISERTKLPDSFFESKEFCDCDGLTFKYVFAKQFYKLYKKYIKEGNIEGAFYAIRNCAWECDDEEDNENAKRCRNICIDLLEKIDCDEEVKLAFKADFLRRSGRFEEVIAEFENRRSENEVIDALFAFEVCKAKEKNDECYTCEVLQKEE